MHIIYKGIPLEFVYLAVRPKTREFRFVFKHGNVRLQLRKNNKNWYFGLTGIFPSEEKETNALFLWIKKTREKGTREKEMMEFYNFIFESPLRLKILMEHGPNFKERYR